MSEPVAVEIHGELRQIKSMADGTYNVIINMPEDVLDQTRILMGWVRDEIRAVIVNETKPEIRKKANGNSTRSRRKIQEG